MKKIFFTTVLLGAALWLPAVAKNSSPEKNDQRGAFPSPIEKSQGPNVPEPTSKDLPKRDRRRRR